MQCVNNNVYFIFIFGMLLFVYFETRCFLFVMMEFLVQLTFVCITQKVNHFPGMGEICRKDLLGRNLTRMLKLFPKEYAIFPRTWVLPAEYVSTFCLHHDLKSIITFVLFSIKYFSASCMY